MNIIAFIGILTWCWAHLAVIYCYSWVWIL